MEITYFCSVTVFSYTHLKKATAVFFFGLLAFAYAEKFFHAHERMNIQDSVGIHAAGDAYAHCTICDFQLAKTAVLPGQLVPSQHILHCPVSFGGEPDTYYFISPSCIAGRGPPAC